MIDEVEVISSGGVPIYYHSNEGPKNDAHFLLQASFITALTQFANELKNGQVKLISMERKNYLLKKSNSMIIIFTSQETSAPEFLNYEGEITDVSEYINNKLVEYKIDPQEIDTSKFDQPMKDLNVYLTEKKLIENPLEYDGGSFRGGLNSLIFRSVGYEPGKCNIGRAERMRRLSFGLTFFTLSFVLFTLFLIFELDPVFRLILAIPNFLGFLGFFQYFYRFCTTNALSESYDMH
jgi:hypothetical protein